MLYTFPFDKYYFYLQNIELSILVLLQAYEIFSVMKLSHNLLIKILDN